ncbi:Lrp/AsnC family transcriptional regulator, partial [Paraburkholderia tropica]
MDLTNQKILHLLEQNSKLSLSEIGKEVNLSTPSVRERIYKLIDSKIIERYT